MKGASTSQENTSHYGHANNNGKEKLRVSPKLLTATRGWFVVLNQENHGEKNGEKYLTVNAQLRSYRDEGQFVTSETEVCQTAMTPVTNVIEDLSNTKLTLTEPGRPKLEQAEFLQQTKRRTCL